MVRQKRAIPAAAERAITSFYTEFEKVGK